MTTVDNPLAVDGVLRFGSDVKVTSVQRAFGLLVGLSQDVYVPSGIALAARVPHALVLDGAEPTADTDGAGVRGLTIDLLQPARVQSVSSATSSLRRMWRASASPRGSRGFSLLQGNPLEQMANCQRQSELRMAANFFADPG